MSSRIFSNVLLPLLSHHALSEATNCLSEQRCETGSRFRRSFFLLLLFLCWCSGCSRCGSECAGICQFSGNVDALQTCNQRLDFRFINLSSCCADDFRQLFSSNGLVQLMQKQSTVDIFH